MPALFYDPVFLTHETAAGHPEQPERLKSIVESLSSSPRYPAEGPSACPQVDLEVLHRVHEPRYVQAVESLCAQGGGHLEADTIVSAGSYLAALAACGAAVSAVEGVVRGDFPSAFCALRPPGHHALPSRGMGFCLFNNIAVAAMHARTQLGLEQVLIVDWDVHHGNGTQAVFDSDPSVWYLSVHRGGHYYPGTGGADERGKAGAEGTKLNFPLPAGSGPQEFQRALAKGLERVAAKARPELILISCGFDAADGDPLGGMRLNAQAYAEATARVRAFAHACGHERMVSVLEGGYRLDRLSDCARAHFEAMP